MITVKQINKISKTPEDKYDNITPQMGNDRYIRRTLKLLRHLSDKYKKTAEKHNVDLVDFTEAKALHITIRQSKISSMGIEE